MIFKHSCLDGEERTGQELDCPQCRVLLLDSFRDIPAVPLSVLPEIPPCHCPACDGSMCSYCGFPKGEPGCAFCWRLL